MKPIIFRTKAHLEKPVEKYLTDSVKKLHKEAKAIKMICTHFTGLPDRLVCVPGILVFVECKRPTGGKLSPRQILVHAWLKRIGANVMTVKNKEEVDELIKFLKLEIENYGAV